MTSATATPSVATLGVRELRAMSRDAVDALSEAERLLRRELLLNDRALVGIAAVGDDFSLTHYAVWKWRGNFLRTGEPSANALIAPANNEECRQPGDGPGASKMSPVWYIGDVRRWGVQNGNLDEDLFARKGGRKKPGRPPRAKTVDGETE